jgi:hypothetical protein
MNRSMRLHAAALFVAAWIGAALITVAVVAPGAFAVLPSRTMAGTMVGRVLPALFIAGMVIGVLVAVVTSSAPSAGARRWASASALLAALACFVAQFGITPRLDRLRAEIGGPVDALPAADARRVAFGLLHGYNVAGLGVAMLGAAVCLGFLLFAMRPRT